jgi:hypothetical protein
VKAINRVAPVLMLFGFSLRATVRGRLAGIRPA